jgi:hypothetical protein
MQLAAIACLATELSMVAGAGQDTYGHESKIDKRLDASDLFTKPIKQSIYQPLFIENRFNSGMRGPLAMASLALSPPGVKHMDGKPRS